MAYYNDKNDKRTFIPMKNAKESYSDLCRHHYDTLTNLLELTKNPPHNPFSLNVSKIPDDYAEAIDFARGLIHNEIVKEFK